MQKVNNNENKSQKRNNFFNVTTDETLTMGQKVIKYENDGFNAINNNMSNDDDYDYNDDYVNEFSDYIIDGNNKKNGFSLLKYSLSFPITFNNNYVNQMNATPLQAQIEDEYETTIEEENMIIENTDAINNYYTNNNEIIATSSNKNTSNCDINVKNKNYLNATVNNLNTNKLTATKQETLSLLLKSIHKLKSSSELLVNKCNNKIPISKSTMVIANKFSNQFENDNNQVIIKI